MSELAADCIQFYASTNSIDGLKLIFKTVMIARA